LRIWTVINQSDIVLTIEINLKLSLESNDNGESADFATVGDKLIKQKNELEKYRKIY
jgi:hypothetical protein